MILRIYNYYVGFFFQTDSDAAREKVDPEDFLSIQESEAVAGKILNFIWLVYLCRHYM